MIDAFLVKDVARLSRLTDASAARSLCQITALAVSSVPACCASTMTVWYGKDDYGQPTGTHPDVIRLAEAELALGEGPGIDALRQGATQRVTIVSNDTLTENRWPRFTKLALRVGARSFLARTEPIMDAVVCLTLWSVRPDGFRTEAQDEGLLTARLANTAMTNVTRYERTLRIAAQLHESVDARAIIDQAKGALMHSIGCDADAAFARLREESQRTHTKVVDVARKILADIGGRHEP